MKPYAIRYLEKYRVLAALRGGYWIQVYAAHLKSTRGGA